MKKQNKALVLFRMLKLVKPLSGYMILAVIFGTLGFLTAEFIPILGGEAILIGLGFRTKLSWNMLVLLLLAFAILRAIFRLAEQRTNHYIAFTLLAIIRDRVFKALRRLCPAKLEGRDKGDLISLITSDVELLEVFYAHTISPICIAVCSETIMCLFIGSFHPLLGIAALISFVFVGVILPVIISKRSGTAGDELRAQSGELSAHMLESIRGIDDTLQYSYGQKRLKEIGDKTNILSERQKDLSRLTGTNMAIANMLILISDIVMLLICTWLYQSGQVGFDGFLIPMISLMSSFGPVTALAALGTTLQNTVASGARVLAIIDEEPETEDITGKSSVDFTGAEIKDVSFAYLGENVLNNVSLKVPKGKIIGIVGKSGCGKSTLLKLIMRFWKAGSGEISVSGRNIAEINTDDLRDMESYMTQETQLFKDTIANNIRIGKLDATDEEVAKACKKASIHDFIMTLPKGYETEVGELGSTLSGGERQRIGLARAFLHNAPLMLLDEPTSNLDSLNEAIILKSLKEETKEKTIMLVSHRESTMRIADEILAMEGGRIS
ncbi:MAG: ABC transporter ATP-binding protein [Butyrivibrio sp.]|uniref:amino acid ABC transporter ATP-binding/permease protein n=1 Tax=Butyrivibrio sp. TaxID=28121 RepID=UPI001B095153|nr:ABC transporter ATP-binding protein [Butyrivibrio sp.]MBO6241678.1 ABC transporter ATP-binding protein [Butyrivibrio sp.]